MEKWYQQQAKDNDIIISSRIRLARNVKGVLFSERLQSKEAEELVNHVLQYTDELSQKESMPYYRCIVNQMRDLDKNSLAEWHLISNELAEKDQSTGLVVSADDSVSVMVNEEDHLRIQSVLSGRNLSKALEKANEIDDFYNEKLTFAYNQRYGYLTSCPTNVGTGMRASYQMFLPALSMTGKIEHLAEEMGKYGVQVKGVFGEGTKSIGHIYQLSNKTTLGKSEAEIIDNLDQIAAKAMEQELKRREYLLAVSGDEIEDKVYRSYGVLKYAKKLNTADAIKMLAQLRFGVETNLITFSRECNIYQLMMEITPGNLQKILGTSITTTQRDRRRASYINKMLPELLQKERN